MNNKEKQFVKYYAETSNMAEAARRTGIPVSTASLWLDRPEIMAAIHLQVLATLQRAAPKALNLLMEIMINPETPVKVQVAVAESVLDRAGITRNRKSPVDTDTAAIENMTRADLVKFIASLEQGKNDSNIIEGTAEHIELTPAEHLD